MKKQSIREILYFVMSGGVILKILAGEISRILMGTEGDRNE